MKKYRNILMVLVALFIGGLFFVQNGNNDNLEEEIELTEKNKIVKWVDLDNDGVNEKIVLENRKSDLSGDVYLSVDDVEYLVAQDYNDPEYKMYEMELEFYNLEEEKIIFVNLNQYINGTANNSYPSIYTYKTSKMGILGENRVELLWEMPNSFTPFIESKIQGSFINFYDEGDVKISEYKISDLKKEQVNLDSINDIPLNIDDYFLSVPVHVSIEENEGKLVLSVFRVIRGPVFYAMYEESYDISPAGVLISQKNVDLDWFSK